MAGLVTGAFGVHDLYIVGTLPREAEHTLAETENPPVVDLHAAAIDDIKLRLRTSRSF